MTAHHRVLVVDDTAAHRYLMVSWLRTAGYEVLEAATGAEALDRATADTGVVVLDVNLPDLSGREVCRRLKDDDVTRHVPVLHVSATSIDAAARTAGLEGGADAYLPEPLDRDEFLATVRSLCRGHDERRASAREARLYEAMNTALVPLHGARSAEEAVGLAARGATTVLARPAIAMIVVDPTTVLRAVCTDPGSPLVRGSGESPVLPPSHQDAALVPRDALPEPWRPLLERAGVAPCDWWTSWLRDEHGQLVGGLGVQVRDPSHAPSSAEREIIRRFTEASAVALSNLRTFAEERRITVALQEALLPQDLTVRPGVDVAACYEASDERLDVGGDFYDAFDLPDGRVAVVIGDVQGHSLRAATVMGEVRITLRAYLREGHTAARALDLLNEMLRTDHPEMATLCLCVIDPVTGQAELSDAGHLPTILVRTDGTTRALKAPSRLLGLLSSPDVREPYRERLETGDLLVLVTDGLVERRGSTLREGIDRLTEVARSFAGAAPDDVCQGLLKAFDGDGEDDVAVVVVRRTDAAPA